MAPSCIPTNIIDFFQIILWGSCFRVFYEKPCRSLISILFLTIKKLIAIEEINFNTCIKTTTYANHINGLENENRAKIIYAISKINIFWISNIDGLFIAIIIMLTKLDAANTAPI